MITDAKALYDSYNKEGLTGSSSVDKRTSLEIRFGKEQLQALGGVLKWMSSEKQFADGLTKSSTRNLLADRLRHHRQKLVWDPNYTSAKRKDAAEREASRNEFAKMKESNQPQPPLQLSTSTSPPTEPQHETCDDGTYEMEDEDMAEETYDLEMQDTHVETYVPVEAYPLKNVNAMAMALGTLSMLPTASAMHDLDHEYGQDGIWFFAILAMMVFCLLLGFWMGSSHQQRRHLQVMDAAYERIDGLQRADDDQNELIRRLRCQAYDQAGRGDELERQLIFQQRSANVMAIMMASQISVIQFLQNQVDRLRSLIANHQAPCPLGDTVLIQATLDGAVWHIDPECPVIDLNRIHEVTELDHCEYCCARDRAMVTDPAFTGRQRR